jgi:hypothetical protein
MRFNKHVFGVGVGILLFQISTKAALAYNVFCDSNGNLAHDPDLSNPMIYTALGCVPAKIDKFIEWLLPNVFSVAGGISFLLMIYGFFMLATSKGDPKVVQGAQETITSAITGLIVSIFALFLLRLIAVDILQIPGINK